LPAGSVLVQLVITPGELPPQPELYCQALVGTAHTVTLQELLYPPLLA
jgi:hypothetical protein